jgi:hypothetical protein
MKIRFAVALLMCSWASLAMAQDKPQDKPQDNPPAEKKADGGQCLIVAPRPVFKYEMRDSYNLAKENVKDIYKGSDLSDLRKQGVHVIIIDPLAKQLEKAQAACKEPQK